MIEQRYTTEIVLNADQQQALTQLARIEGRSVAEVATELVQRGLGSDDDAPTRRQRRLAALDRIQQHANAILARRGGQPLDWDVVADINQMREERDTQILAAIAESAEASHAPPAHRDADCD